MLRELQGGCLAPIGAVSNYENETVYLRGVVLSPDGQTKFESKLSNARLSPIELGRHVARQLLEQGADQILNN